MTRLGRRRPPAAPPSRRSQLHGNHHANRCKPLSVWTAAATVVLTATVVIVCDDNENPTKPQASLGESASRPTCPSRRHCRGGAASHPYAALRVPPSGLMAAFYPPPIPSLAVAQPGDLWAFNAARFFISCSGAAFVTTTLWTSTMFAYNVVRL